MSIAQSHYNLGNYASTITECECLLAEFQECDESYSTLLLLLGHSYLGMKNHLMARKHYEAVLACPAASPSERAVAERCLAKIERL